MTLAEVKPADIEANELSPEKLAGLMR